MNSIWPTFEIYRGFKFICSLATPWLLNVYRPSEGNELAGMGMDRKPRTPVPTAIDDDDGPDVSSFRCNKFNSQTALDILLAGFA